MAKVNSAASNESIPSAVSTSTGGRMSTDVVSAGPVSSSATTETDPDVDAATNVPASLAEKSPNSGSVLIHTIGVPSIDSPCSSTACASRVIAPPTSTTGLLVVMFTPTASAPVPT